MIHNTVMKGQKIIVFTESKETAEYLCEGLKDLYVIELSSIVVKVALL